MKQFKVRSSSTHKIMGKKALGETGLTYIKEWLKEEEFGRRKEVKTKYMDKGNQNEEEGFTMLAVHLGLGMVRKNLELFENEYTKGTPDLIKSDVVYDNKASWDLSTFPMYTEDLKAESEYWWQLQSYMWLTKSHKAVLGYTLSNASDELIANEIRWIEDLEKKQRRIMDMVFTDEAWGNAIDKFCGGIDLIPFIPIPEERRVKTFNVDFDKSIITRIPGRVIECREIIKSLTNNK